jgi:hypothetical protein
MQIYTILTSFQCVNLYFRGTIIQDNVNPIAKAEKSALLLATTIFGAPAANLVAGQGDIERLTENFPEIMAPVGAVEIYNDSDN